MKNTLILTLMITLLLVTACQQSLRGEPNLITGEIALEQDTVIVAPVMEETPAPEEPAPEPVELKPEYYTITRTEGDLVVLAPEAIDPDGDEITFSFSSPFNSDGKWQTTAGDEGEYLVTVTATDTKGASVSEVVRVVLLRANRGPSLDCPAKITLKEGEIVVIDCAVDDPDGDEVVLTYQGWMDSRSKETTFADAGTYTVKVTARDSADHVVSDTVTIIIENQNRAPSFPRDWPTRIVADEGDVVMLDTADIRDEDEDELDIAFSAPFDEKGVWRTKVGDAGEYPIEVTASDGSTSVTESLAVIINMVNTAPELRRIANIVVEETETIMLDIVATDREGDTLTFSISGWMNAESYTTDFDDAGEYTTTVTVSDGKLSDSQEVQITVRDKNRAPVFKRPA